MFYYYAGANVTILDFGFREKKLARLEITFFDTNCWSVRLLRYRWQLVEASVARKQVVARRQ